MCSIWEGLPGGGKGPLISLPTEVTRALLLPPNNLLVLLTQDGEVLLYEGKSRRTVSKDLGLGPVRDLTKCYEEMESTSGGEREDGDGRGEWCKDSVMLLLSSGQVYKVELSDPPTRQLVEFPSFSLASLSCSRHHAIYSDTLNQVWSRGSVPYSGQVHESKEFSRVTFFSGMQVLSLACGTDFSLCIVAHSEEVASPLSPLTPGGGVGFGCPPVLVPADEADGPSCPLGLSLKTTTNTQPPAGRSRPAPLEHTTPEDSKVDEPDATISSTPSSLEREEEEEKLSSSSEVAVTDNNSATQLPTASEVEEIPTDPLTTSITSTNSTTTSTVTTTVQRNSTLASVQEWTRRTLVQSFSAVQIETARPPSPPHPHQQQQQKEEGRSQHLAPKSSSEPRESTLSHGGGTAAGQTLEPGYEFLEGTAAAVATWPKNGLAAKRSASISGLTGKSFRLAEPKSDDLEMEGARLRKCEVWSWGAGARGQLGQGDMLPRPTPSPIPSLHPHHVVKISVGSRHSLALTGSGLVFGWGDNSQGQACPTDSLAVVLYPTRLQVPLEDTVRDVAAEGTTSAVVCDNGKMYLFGFPGARFQMLKLPGLSPTGSTSASLQAVSLHLASNHILLNLREVSQLTMSLVAKEKVIVQRLESVGGFVSTLFPSHSPGKKAVTSVKQQQQQLPSSLHLIEQVGESVRRAADFMTLCVSKSVNCIEEPDYSHSGLYRYLTAWKEVIGRVCEAVCNCISMDALYLDSSQSQHLHMVSDLLITKFLVPQQSIKGQMELEQLFSEVLKLADPYTKTLAQLQIRLADGQQRVMEKVSELLLHLQLMDKEKQEADRTREFWKSAGARLEEFRIPARRLVLDSRYSPLYLAGAMTRHWLLLVSDLLIDSAYQLTVHPLDTVWLESLPLLPNSTRFEIVLTMPEESKTLVASSSSERNVWVQALLRAITNTVRKKSSNSHLPPINRSAKYEFTKGEWKGCVYEGTWTQAKMHGKGCLTWPDGSVYMGEWRGGLQDGWGKLQKSDGTRREGTWRSGKLTGNGRLTDPDGSHYEGDVLDSLPHGHGTKKEGKFMGRGASVYIGEWERGTKSGYGVLDDITGGEKYMGLWSGGAKNGKGCVVNSDGIYYEGSFVGGKLTGGGTMIFEDGAVYEGEFCGAGEFSGRGVLTTATERFEGVFHGNYGDRMRFNGQVIRRAEPGTPTEHADKLRVHTVPPQKKWRSIFDRFDRLLGSENPWEQMAIAINQGKVAAREKGLKVSGLDYLEMIPDAGRSGQELDWPQYREVKEYLAAAGQCSLHPFSEILKQLVECFITSYGGVRSHSTLLPHTKEELDSLCSRLYVIIRRLFPLLPDLTTELWLSNPETGEQALVTPNTLLLPLLLPPLHPTIFTLYALREQKLDKEYWARIIRWNRHSDATLLTFFDLDFSCWDLPGDHRSRDQLFLGAIDTLQRLKTTFTPEDKMEVVIQTFKAITSQWETARHTWNMDSLLPVCMYVVVRARVLQLGAELAMLQDFMETHLFQGEQGIMYTTLLAAYNQILKESVFIN